MNKKICVLQEDKNDCGSACVLSLIKYYGGMLDLEAVRVITNTTKMGTNAYDIICGCKQIGFDGFGKKVSFSYLVNNFTIPVICHMKKKGYYHFVVVYKVNTSKKKLLVMDPAIGLTWVSYLKFQEDFLGTIIILTKVKELPKIEKRNELLKLIISESFKNKYLLFKVSFISLLVFIFSLLSSIYYKVLLDDSSNLIKYLYIFSVIFVLKNILDFIRNVMMNKFDKELDFSINKIMLDRIFALPYSYYKNKTTGEVISRIDDLSITKDLIIELLFSSFVYILLILGSITFLIMINYMEAIISVIVFIIYLVISIIFNNFNNKRIKILQEEKGYYKHKLIESLEGIESINNLGVKNLFKDSLNKYYKNNTLIKYKYSLINIISYLLKTILLDFGSILVLFIGVLILDDITIGSVMLIYVLYGYFIDTLKYFMDKIPEVNYAIKNISKVNSLLKEYPSNSSNLLTHGDIVIKNIKSINNKTLDRVINCTFNKGEKVLLLGNSGSGKSSLLKVILKYYTMYSGDIYINNINIKDISNDVINNSFTYIGQNEKIFNDTIRNNIILNRNISNKEYSKVLSITKVDEIINSKTLRDETLVEEDGFNLSGGERQRIILARALLKDSNYLLIDEALSEVDSDLEISIIKEVINNYNGKTIIYVTHKNKVRNLFSKKIYLERRNK